MAGAPVGPANQHANPVNVKDGSSTISATPAPACPTNTIGRVKQAYHDIRCALSIACSRYLWNLALARTGADFADVLRSLLPGLKLALEVYFGSVAAFAALGAGLGSLAGGAGAWPGVLAGAKLGSIVGMIILEVMGVGFLAVYVAAHIHDARVQLTKGFKTAWDACGSPPSIDMAAFQLADGMAQLISLIAQGLLAYAAKEGTAAAIAKLQKSTYGEGLAAWLKRNAQKGNWVGGGVLERVGRWMPVSEYELMRDTGIVQASLTGEKNVIFPPNPAGYKNPPAGWVYVEFDVPASSLANKSVGQKIIYGPKSLGGRLAVQKGLPPPEMPPATNIKIVLRK